MTASFFSDLNLRFFLHFASVEFCIDLIQNALKGLKSSSLKRFHAIKVPPMTH